MLRLIRAFIEIIMLLATVSSNHNTLIPNKTLWYLTCAHIQAHVEIEKHHVIILQRRACSQGFLVA